MSDSPPSAGLLARNTVFNVGANVLPLLVGVFAIPFLVSRMGTERFSLLLLAMTIIGYCIIFDLGTGKALTKLTAELVGAGRRHEIPILVSTAIILIAVMGVAGGAALALLTPWTVHSFLKIPDYLKTESIQAFHLLACTVPFVIVTSGLRGVMEAHQDFARISVIRLCVGISSYLGPCLALLFSDHLLLIVGTLFIGRFASFVIHLAVCIRLVPFLKLGRRFEKELLKKLARLGGWMSLSNIVGIVMGFSDRFLIGAIIALESVAYYATPYDVAIKIFIIPFGLAGVLFPAFSSVLGQKNRTAAGNIFRQALWSLFFILFPLIMVITLFSFEAIDIWLGESFAENSAGVMRILAGGVYINCFGSLAVSLIQSSGRPDISARIHLLEFPLYMAILWILLKFFGIEGAAWAYFLKAAFEAVMMFWVGRLLLPETFRAADKAFATASAALLFIGAAAFIPALPSKTIYLATVTAGFYILAWKKLLDPTDREAIRDKVATLVSPEKG